MLSELKGCLERSPIVRMGDYEYFVSPITDGIPHMPPKVLIEITDRILDVSDLDCDLIVAPEAMGIPIAVSVSLRTGIPYNVVRKRSYGLPGEVAIHQVTGYSKCQMYVNGLKRGDRAMIVDDVISTGGTLKAIVQAFTMMGVNISDMVVVIERGTRRTKLEEELKLRIKTLVSAEIIDGRVVVREGSAGGRSDIS